jgi:Sulfatase
MTSIKALAFVLGAALMATMPGSGARAQDAQSAATLATAQPSLPYAEPRFRGNVGTTFEDSDPAAFPAPIKAPEGASNVLLILLDDVGFGQFSVAGGGVPTRKLEELAQDGVFYDRFHTTALCSPTRGRPAHRAQSPRVRNRHHYRIGDRL